MIVKKLRNIALILALLLPTFSFSQLSIIPISADNTIFSMNDSLAYVEFYLSFYMNNLEYTTHNDSLKASFETAIEIKNNDQVVRELSHPFIHLKTDTQNKDEINSFSDAFGTTLPYDKYDVTITLKNANSGVAGEYKFELNAPTPPDDFFLSGIQLSSKIEKATTDGKYTKNGLNIIPHPQQSYGPFQPMLYYYLELNKLNFIPEQSNSYDIQFFVTNEQDDTLKTGPVKSKSVAASTMAEVGGFNIITLPQGINFLNITVIEKSSSIKRNVKKRFYVHKAGKVDDNSASLSEIDPGFQSMNMDELKLEFDKARYIADRKEIDLFSKLENNDAFRTFLTKFWRSRDTRDNIPYGESRRTYLTLCDEANSKFTRGFKEGWKSDRGRIFLTYNSPDEIERYPSSIDSKPYIIWYYHKLHGGVEFVFLDRMGFGSYELIHSSYYKELQNPNWRNEVRETSRDSGNFGF